MQSNSHPSLCALSRREAQVLDRLSRGDIDKEVASNLGITLGTVRTYRKRAMLKLGTQGLVQAVLVAWRLGELDLEAIAEEAMARRSTSTDPYRKGGRSLSNDPEP